MKLTLGLAQILIALAVSQFPGSPFASIAHARDFGSTAPGLENETPNELKDVQIIEHRNEQVDLDLPFKNEAGETVPLRSFFKDGKPVLLTLAYYSCPSLCNFHLNGLLDAFKGMKQPLGSEFNVVVVSIEPKETPELAAAKKATYIKAYGRPEGAEGWHFLTGEQEQIKKIANQVGFQFRWDEQEQQWAHAAAAYVLTPEGKISQYLYGIVFDSQAVRLALVDASDGKIGSIVDKLILYCFHFDPKTGKYSLIAFNAMRLGGGLVVLILAMFLAPFWFRNQREQRRNRSSNSSDDDTQSPGTTHQNESKLTSRELESRNTKRLQGEA